MPIQAEHTEHDSDMVCSFYSARLHSVPAANRKPGSKPVGRMTLVPLQPE